MNYTVHAWLVVSAYTLQKYSNNISLSRCKEMFRFTSIIAWIIFIERVGIEFVEADENRPRYCHGKYLNEQNVHFPSPG